LSPLFDNIKNKMKLTSPTDAYYANTKTKSTIMNYATVDESLATEDWFVEGTKEVRYG
jgi:hypothetical protein